MKDSMRGLCLCASIAFASAGALTHMAQMAVSDFKKAATEVKVEKDVACYTGMVDNDWFYGEMTLCESKDRESLMTQLEIASILTSGGLAFAATRQKKPENLTL